MKWETLKTKFVDLETGEEIKMNKEKYIVVKHTKKIEYHDQNTRATIQWIGECRRNPQGKLF